MRLSIGLKSPLPRSTAFGLWSCSPDSIMTIFGAWSLSSRPTNTFSGGAVEVDLGLTREVVRVALPRPGQINCTWVFTSSQEHLIEKVGTLSSAKLDEVENLIRMGDLGSMRNSGDAACQGVGHESIQRKVFPLRLGIPPRRLGDA